MNQSTKVQHTPTPWRIHRGSADKYSPNQDVTLQILGGKKGSTWGVANVIAARNEDMHTQSANAAFIVRAVNSHEELLNAAKKYLTYSNSLDHDVQRELINAIAKAEDKPL